MLRRLQARVREKKRTRYSIRCVVSRMQKWQPRIQSNQFKLKAISSKTPVTDQIALYGRLLTGHLSFKQIMSSRFLYLHFPHIPLWTLRSGESWTVNRTLICLLVKNNNFFVTFTCFSIKSVLQWQPATWLGVNPFSVKIFTFQMQFPSERSLRKGYATRICWFRELCCIWEFVRSWDTSKKEHRLLYGDGKHSANNIIIQNAGRGLNIKQRNVTRLRSV